MHAQTDYLTPPQYAEELGIATDKVYAWIASGQLRAINVAERSDGRPRYRIPRDAREEFEARRTLGLPVPPKRRRRAPADVEGPF